MAICPGDVGSIEDRGSAGKGLLVLVRARAAPKVATGVAWGTTLAHEAGLLRSGVEPGEASWSMGSVGTVAPAEASTLDSVNR